jgi:hypothetical protein
MRSKEPIPGPYAARIGSWTPERCSDGGAEEPGPEVRVWRGHDGLARHRLRPLAGCREVKGQGKALVGPAALRMLPVVGEPDLFVAPPEEASKGQGVSLKVRLALTLEATGPATCSMDLREKAVERLQGGGLLSQAAPGFRSEMEWLFQEPPLPAAARQKWILSLPVA